MPIFPCAGSAPIENVDGRGAEIPPSGAAMIFCCRDGFLTTLRYSRVGRKPSLQQLKLYRKLKMNQRTDDKLILVRLAYRERTICLGTMDGIVRLVCQDAAKILGCPLAIGCSLANLFISGDRSDYFKFIESIHRDSLFKNEERQTLLMELR